MANTVKADLANAITFELKRQTIPVVRQALRYAQFGQDGQILPGTDTLRFVKYPDLGELGSTTTYQLNADEITSPAPEALPAITTVNVTTTEYGRTVGITRKATNYSPLDLVSHAKDTLAYDASRLMDTLVRDEITANGTVLYVGTGNAARTDIASTEIITMSDCRKMLIKLQSLDLATDNILAVTHPFVVGDLMNDTSTPGGWVAAQIYTNAAPIFNGEVGKAFGVRFITTTRGKTFASTTTVYATMVGLGPWAFGKASVEALRFTAVAPTPDHADPLGRTWILGYAMDWGCKTLDSTKFLRFESAATSV